MDALLVLGPLFAIDFGMLFLSTNNRKRIASDFHELDSAVWIILLDSISETALNPFLRAPSAVKQRIELV
ncbi:010a4210-950a-44ad-a9f8-69d0d7944815 [Thermothielavioides terrestris]|uniref:010a4210-950a-44ad-a9f8-69d0d7944815 n=1 Tax=Thermothielavioides terrestris TaxID=2587410 RepID=A0A446BUQ9_9PEZI|nr:010a4210-950a-44ad-a9f8-69d0d7944815 [Thermothielavioides terrestris]